MKKANMDIRCEVGAHDLKLWQIAYKLGIADTYFSRMLRVELSPEKKQEIRAIINELCEEQEA